MDMEGFRYFLIRMIYLLFIKFAGWDCASEIQFYSFGKHRLGIAGAFFLPAVRNVNMKSPPGQFYCCGLWGIEWAGILLGYLSP